MTEIESRVLILSKDWKYAEHEKAEAATEQLLKLKCLNNHTK
jgi:hypothetical protein